MTEKPSRFVGEYHIIGKSKVTQEDLDAVKRADAESARIMAKIGLDDSAKEHKSPAKATSH
jgi:hypothetical protein